jgi:hypothetical protein
MWKEAVLALYEVLIWHLPWATEENHDDSVLSVVDLWPRFEPGRSEYEEVPNPIGPTFSSSGVIKQGDKM